MLYFFIYCLFVVIRLLELTRGRLKSPGETSRPKDTPLESSFFAARLEWILPSLTVGECPSPISRLHLNALGGSLHIFRVAPHFAGRGDICHCAFPCRITCGPVVPALFYFLNVQPYRTMLLPSAALGRRVCHRAWQRLVNAKKPARIA